MSKVDILILSNGPGEVTTWVRPVVQALRQNLGNDRTLVRISVMLSPCPNATGKEAAIAQSFPEVDRVQSASAFWQFLLWGKTLENWEWRDRGVVLFLGGDQFFPIVIGKRLGYRTVVYAEWDARWHSLIDRFAVMKPKVAAHVQQKYAHKFTVVGDLMVEAQGEGEIVVNSPTPNTVRLRNLSVEADRGAGEVERQGEERDDRQLVFSSPTSPAPLIGILPGSKAAKLMQGVPFTLASAEYVYARKPETKFVIPVAPTLDIQTLASFADPQKNPYIKTFGGGAATLVESEPPVLKTATGLSVELWTQTPAYDLLSQCSLCLTTVGANTAELGALAVPMIVLLPTYQMDSMRSWDGLPGLLANLPFVGSSFAKVINWLVLKRIGLLAWPNIWAQEMVVPELVGKLQPQDIGEMVLDFLTHPEKLEQIRTKLRSIRGEAGAAQKIASLVSEVLNDESGGRG